MAIELQTIVPTISLSSDWIIPGSAKSITLNNSPPSRKLVEDIEREMIRYVLVYLNQQNNKTTKTNIGVLCEARKDKAELGVALNGLQRAAIILKIESPHYELVAIEKLDDDLEDLAGLRPKIAKLRELFLRFASKNAHTLNLTKNDLLQILPSLKKPVDQDDITKVVWRLVSLVPIEDKDYKNLFLSGNRLSERILLCIACLDGALARDLQLRLKPGAAEEQLARLEKDLNSDPNLAERFQKFLAIKDGLPEDAKKVAIDDFKKLVIFNEGRGSSSADYSMVINHLDFLLDMPWNKETEQEKSIGRVKDTLDADHACLPTIKERICDYIAPKTLNPKGRAGILCFVGPPGVGKTSLGASIARGLNRKFVRMSVGGENDEAEIKGHRRTYIGALPGKILKLIKQCESKNPVFMIDEIDKMEKSVRGNPSAALLEVLDPEQNHAFDDHYLDAPFDLSQVFFICTANVEDDIPVALRDRMDVIALPGYTEEEKLEIAKRFLVPKALIEVGLTQHEVVITWPDEMITKLIREYTKEAGVRELTRRITDISRKNAREFIQHEGAIKSIQISPEMIESFLGPPKYVHEEVGLLEIGEAIGLAWTPYGGEILKVQSEFFPRDGGEFKISQTGLPQEVMRQSNKVALTTAKKELNKKDLDRISQYSIHIHIPEGAIRKDGPSAGITTFCSLRSLFKNKKLRPVAMTGEIDLKNRVKGVGGIKDKLIAVVRAGIKEVILPKANERDLHDVSEEIKSKLQIHFVSKVDEVLKIVFEEEQSP